MNTYSYGEVAEGHGPDVDIFSSKPVNSAILSKQYVKYGPSSKITEGAPIDINVKSGNRYVDLKNSKLCVKYRIVKSDGTPIVAGQFIKNYYKLDQGKLFPSSRKRRKTRAAGEEENTGEVGESGSSTPEAGVTPQPNIATALADTDDNVTLIQASLHTVWRQIDLSFQQKNITSGINIHYAFKSLIDLLIYTSSDVKNTFMFSYGYIKDEIPVNSVSIFDTPANNGLVLRNVITSGGKHAEFEGPICIDICEQDRLIINGVDIQFKFYPNTHSFCLLTPKRNENYKLVIEDVSLNMCLVNMNPAVLVAQSDIIQSSPALYPYNESQIKAFNISSGEYSFTAEDMFQSWLPNELIVCFIDSKAYSGDYSTNPFYFQHKKLDYISLTVDGKNVPGDAYQPNFRDGLYNECYATLLNNQKPKTVSNGITYYEYSQGYTIFVFPISHKDDNEFVNMKKKGLLRLDCRFSSPLLESITVLTYGKFPALMQIDASRNVKFL